MGLEHLTAVLDHSRQGNSRLVVLMIVASYSDQRGEWISIKDWWIPREERRQGSGRAR